MLLPGHTTIGLLRDVCTVLPAPSIMTMLSIKWFMQALISNLITLPEVSSFLSVVFVVFVVFVVYVFAVCVENWCLLKKKNRPWNQIQLKMGLCKFNFSKSMTIFKFWGYVKKWMNLILCGIVPFQDIKWEHYLVFRHVQHSHTGHNLWDIRPCNQHISLYNK